MKSNLLKLIAAVCVVALLVSGVMVLFKSVHIGLNYANAEKYTAGGAEIDGAVKNLDIDWVDGEVNIAYHAKGTVEIAETAPRAISEDEALRWWLDGDTLRIQYAKSGFSLRKLFSFKSKSKTLTVTLPEGVELGDVGIDVTSGDVMVRDLKADNVKIGLTSGDLSIKQSGTTERMELKSTSGNIDAELSDVGDLIVDVTSGDIKVEGGAVTKASVDSTSGKINVNLTAFDDLKIKATSGNITAALPSNPGYRAEVDTTSGSFDYTVALTRDGKAYTCGDGSAHLKIDSTSGNVRLTDVNE